MHIILFMLLCMIFFHILEDFHIQGFLASAKQKVWWEKQYKQAYGTDKELPSKYRYDYLIALLVHSIEWSCFIMIPIFICDCFNGIQNYNFYIYCVLINTIIHSIVDNEKANRLKINLIQDQIIHFAQILCVDFIWYKFF